MTLAHILIVAGSDSSGGAGIVRDIETAKDFSCQTSIAITAVTAQTYQHVIAVEPMPDILLNQQIEAAYSENSIDAVKIGMLATIKHIEVLQKKLCNFISVPIIYDPVLVASSGGALTIDNLKKAIISELLPHVDLITPNINELASLLDEKAALSDNHAIEQAHKLLNKGAKAILVKGGHLNGVQACDYLVTEKNVSIFSHPRLSVQMRGTGCALSTAISCNLANGDTMCQAISSAKNYLHNKLTKISDKKNKIL